MKLLNISNCHSLQEKLGFLNSVHIFKLMYLFYFSEQFDYLTLNTKYIIHIKSIIICTLVFIYIYFTKQINIHAKDFGKDPCARVFFFSDLSFFYQVEPCFLPFDLFPLKFLCWNFFFSSFSQKKSQLGWARTRGYSLRYHNEMSNLLFWFFFCHTLLIFQKVRSFFYYIKSGFFVYISIQI